MPSRSEAFDAVAQGSQNHYDIVTAVMIKHVPVVTGIVGMFVVLAAGLIWDWWYKRSLRGRTDLSVPAPLESHPDMIKAKEEAAIEAKVAAAMDEFTTRLAEAGDDVDRLLAIAPSIDDLPYRDSKARAAFMLAEKLDALNAPDKGEPFHQTAIYWGKREAQDVAALSARHLADYYRDAGQKEQALTFARKAILLFEAADKNDGVEETTQFIRALRA